MKTIVILLAALHGGCILTGGTAPITGSNNGQSNNGQSNQGSTNNGQSTNGATTNGELCGGTFKLDPKSTFLRVETADELAELPLILTLSSLGLEQGEAIVVSSTGTWRNTGGINANERPNGNFVFSSSDALEPPHVANRVPGAVGIDCQAVAMSAFAEDCNFGASPSTVVVPAGAKFVFFGVHDTLYSDNSDGDGDFHAVIECL